MPFFGSGGYERNDPDYSRVISDNRRMRRAIQKALEIADSKKSSLGKSEYAELRVTLMEAVK